MSDSTAVKSNVFVEELALAAGGTGAIETGTRKTSTGGTVTLTKVDQGHIKFRSHAGTPEDLIDGGQDVDIYPKNIDAAGYAIIDGAVTVGGAVTITPMSSAGYVKNSAAGLLSGGNALTIAAGDLPTGIDAAKIATGVVSNAEFICLDGVTSGIQAQINGISAVAAVSPFAILQNRQTKNTAGGTATTGAWNIYPLNSEYEDANGIVTTTALPAFSLGAGTYRVEGYVLFFQTNASQIRLYNVSDAGAQDNVNSLDILGTSVLAIPATCGTIASFIDGTFVIAGTKQFRIEYQTYSTAATTGFGYPGNFDVEVYGQIKITQLA